MRRDEAALMGKWLTDLPLQKGAVCLNIGSSTEAFRTLGQAHIEDQILVPLRAKGVKIIHCDLKDDPGVDLVGDVLEPSFQAKLRSLDAKLLICSNLLEHLEDPQGFADACASLVAPNGYALFTVPRDYPFHPDPIDTMFRPTPDELAGIFRGWTVVNSAELECGDFFSDLKATGRFWRKVGRYALRLVTPFYRPRYWLSYAHRLLWLVRKYRVTLLLIQKARV